MRIFVTHGKGEGATKLAAFDAALWDAGIGNYNIIKLSSVIPDNSQVLAKRLNWNDKEHGYKLYCVLSQAITDVIGRKICAGLGWASVDGIGRGIFVEHHGSDEEEVRKQIEASIMSLVRYRSEEHGMINYKIESAECRGVSTCVLVAAVYATEGWAKREESLEEELPSLVSEL